jgi:osmotically inducible lipoprotein OsmB
MLLARPSGTVEQEHSMKIRTISTSAVVLALAMGLGACSNMSRQDKATAAGAAIGGVAGSVLTNGSAVGTIGGAAVGGVIGHEVEKK